MSFPFSSRPVDSLHYFRFDAVRLIRKKIMVDSENERKWSERKESEKKI